MAITATMLVAFGFKPMKAASVALVANTAPVAFGAIAIPIVTLAGLTEIPKEDLGAMVGRQTPLLALFVPLILVGMVDGWRGVKAVWPAAVVGGVSFAIGQFACSNYLSVELTDIVASLLSVGAMVGFLRVWQPGTPLVAERAPRGGPAIAGAATADAAHEAAIRRREERQGGGAGPDAAGERELVRRRAGQDGLAAEPGDRGRRRRPRRAGGRGVPQGHRLEPAAAVDHVRPGLPAVDGGVVLDGRVAGAAGPPQRVRW